MLFRSLKVKPELQENVTLYTYSENSGDFHAENIRIGNGTILFDFVYPQGRINDVEPGVPVRINIENGIAAMAIALLNGASKEEVKKAMKSFAGPKRRFDFHLKTDNKVLIDDYAHHPDEIRASISSVKALYPDKKLSVVFQPHLYSRTNDFAAEFAKSLSIADEVILLDIYPAREKPIPGVTSDIIFNKITSPEKSIIEKNQLLSFIKERNFEVLMMIGAGDIDRLVIPVKEILENDQKNS